MLLDILWNLKLSDILDKLMQMVDECWNGFVLGLVENTKIKNFTIHVRKYLCAKKINTIFIWHIKIL